MKMVVIDKMVSGKIDEKRTVAVFTILDTGMRKRTDIRTNRWQSLCTFVVILLRV